MLVSEHLVKHVLYWICNVINSIVVMYFETDLEQDQQMT